MNVKQFLKLSLLNLRCFAFCVDDVFNVDIKLSGVIDCGEIKSDSKVSELRNVTNEGDA